MFFFKHSLYIHHVVVYRRQLSAISRYPSIIEKYGNILQLRIAVYYVVICSDDVHTYIHIINSLI